MIRDDDPVNPTDPIDPIEEPKPVEPVEPVEPVKRVERRKRDAPIKHADRRKRSAKAKPADRVEPVERVETPAKVEPVASDGPVAKAEPPADVEPRRVEPVVPPEPAGRFERRKVNAPIKFSDRRKRSGKSERPAPTTPAPAPRSEPVAGAEPVGKVEAAPKVEPVERIEPAARVAPARTPDPVERIERAETDRPGAIERFSDVDRADRIKRVVPLESARPIDRVEPPARPQPRLTPRAVPLPTAVSPARGPARSDPDTVTRWVEAARRGDRDAYGQLYVRFAPMVHAILLARVPRSDVSDLVQDVFLQALKALVTLREANTFGAWVATIARNRAADFHRGSRNVVQLPEDLAAPEGQHGEALAVLALIRRLPDAYRETLMMRLVEGMTGPEIADRTGLTPGSVRVNLHRGMVMIRKWLERPGAVGGKP